MWSDGFRKTGQRNGQLCEHEKNPCWRMGERPDVGRGLDLLGLCLTFDGGQRGQFGWCKFQEAGLAPCCRFSDWLKVHSKQQSWGLNLGSLGSKAYALFTSSSALHLLLFLFPAKVNSVVFQFLNPPSQHCLPCFRHCVSH